MFYIYEAKGVPPSGMALSFALRKTKPLAATKKWRGTPKIRRSFLTLENDADLEMAET